VCFVWISEQTAIISLYNINWLVCITETESVYCAVRTEALNAPNSTLDVETVKYELYWTRMSLYRHSRERDSANGLQDAGEAVVIDWCTDCLCGNLKIVFVMQDSAGLRTTWYRDFVLSRKARSPSANEGWMIKCLWWGKAPWLWRTNGSWRETEWREIQFGEYLTAAFNNVSTWRSILRKWRHVTARIRDDFVLCLDGSEHRRYGNGNDF
jgi:hypothetical protein